MSFKDFINQDQILDVQHFQNATIALIENAFATKSHDCIISKLLETSTLNNTTPVIILCGRLSEEQAALFGGTTLVVESFLQKCNQITVYNITDISKLFPLLNEHSMFATDVISSNVNINSLKLYTEKNNNRNYLNLNTIEVNQNSSKIYTESLIESLQTQKASDLVTATNHSYDFACRTLRSINVGNNK